MQIMRIEVGNKLQMRKKHACGSDIFAVRRIGSDIGIICESCKRELMVPREKLEKMIKKLLSNSAD